MTAIRPEHIGQVAELLAARAADEASQNAKRLAEWRGRLFRDPVDVPVATEPPKWPAFRSSICETAKVTPIRARVKA